ncbi:MAG: Glyoxalase/bleomycin resistance protein/dioxygenase, partial [Frankiales bacterium]|nr:Glyoxalase/bleomycin resistance protein/dioxygenase [Frankiales bacterium]
KGSPGDRWVVATGAGHRLAFQQAPDLIPPDWPDPERPQQFHLNCDTGSRDLRRFGDTPSDQEKHLPTLANFCRRLSPSCAMDVPSERPLVRHAETTFERHTA